MQFLASAASVLCLLASPTIAVPAAAVLPPPAGLTSNTSPALTNTKFQQTVTSTLNKYRAQHAAAPLVWNSALATYAQTQADKCALKHSGGPYGENIYWISSSTLNFTTATGNAVDAWMSEQPYYPDQLSKALHYTAVIWKASQRVGCAWTTRTCSSANGGGFYYFCEFDPQGNFIGQFDQNVS